MIGGNHQILTEYRLLNYALLIKKVLFIGLTIDVLLMFFTSFSLCQHVLHCIGESKSHFLIMSVNMES